MAEMGAEGLSADDGALLIALARETIAARLEDRPPTLPATPPSLETPCGVFVTLRSGTGRDAPLRGCIGRMEASIPLARVVREMADAAAFGDPRFPPLVAQEYPSISIEVTVLSPMRHIASVDEIEVGRHGVYMTKGWRSAVFLPQVACEQGWNRDELLSHLARKAGLPPDAWKDPDARFAVFEGTIFEE